MAEDENSWVFDSLVCFLNGPIWDAPVQNFIEEKSLIFEPNGEDNEDYRKIYDEYKNLVDFMLGNFMEDIGITPVQFEYACNRGHDHCHSVRFDQNIFEQIWAANNYEMFKRMMTQRNVELQLQALELIERKYGILPNSFIPNKKQTEAQIDNTSVGIQNESEDIKQNIETTILAEVAKKFPEEPTEAPELEFLLEEKQILEDTREKINSELEETEKKLVTQETQFQTEYEDTAQNINTLDISEKNTEESMEKSDIINSSNDKTIVPQVSTLESKETKVTGIKQIDQMELKKRQEYLRKQRDKLVALKKEERKNQFHKHDESVGKKARPKSAKAAEAVLAGTGSTIPPQELQLRRALAERLKVEVVERDKK